MVRKSCLLAVLTVLGGLLSAPRGAAQVPSQLPAPSASATVSVEEPNPLPGLPRPPDAPRSLVQEAPATPPFTCAPLPGPYFERDPRLDPPAWPQPGWFAGVDLAVVGPHVKNRLTDMVQIGNQMPDTVHLPSAELNWTVSPRIDLGYRLPSGFGEFALAYQTLSTDGSGSVLGPDGVADLKSRLDVNIGDLDYLSREMSLWPHCGMKWWFGLRLANVYFDSQANEAFAGAAAGSGVFATHTTNHFLGGGPHYGLELTRHWEETGLSLMVRADGATLLGRVQQDFLEVSTSPGPAGGLLTGETRRSNPQDVPMLNVFLGVTWQPPRYPYLHLSAGYEYEYWWNVGRLSTSTSRGEWSEQGILMRAGFNF
jgi:hypothetical protein